MVGHAALSVLFTGLFTVASAQAGLVEDLRDSLREKHHGVTYREARELVVGALDVLPNSTGLTGVDVYCDRTYSVDEKTRQPLSREPLNVEHTWPQSKFSDADRGTKKSDLHHLYPSDVEMNSNRGNFAFGAVARVTKSLKCSVSKLGLGRDGEIRFEPPVRHKGNVARAMFYFAVRYNQRLDAEQEAALREWHKLDPVDEREIYRNNLVERYQGNRNPFIDQPELVDFIADF